MTDLENRLGSLLEEGACAARAPSVERLRLQMRRRRARRRSLTGAAALTITAVLAVSLAPLAGFSGRAPLPAATRVTRTPLITPPTLSAAQRAMVAAETGTLTALPISVVAGGRLTLRGSGCAPRQPVALGFGSTVGADERATVTADSAGAFDGAVTIPVGITDGVLRIWARCSITQYAAVFVSPAAT